MALSALPKTIHILFFIILSSVILYYGAGVLIPLTIAALLAMLFLPLCRKIEQWGLHRNLAIVICVLIITALAVGLFALVSWQIRDLSHDAGQIRQQVNGFLRRAESYISSNLGISKARQEEIIKQQKQQGISIAGMATSVMGSISSAMVNIILVLVYFFLMLNMRCHLYRFILKLVPTGQKDEAGEIVQQCTTVVQKYLGGLALMIGMLWIMYGIGFSIAGVRSAIFFAVLCGLLEIVPFVGNITGTTLTVIVALTQGSGSGVVIGVLVTYALVQFIQTYIIEPLVVGAEVNLNPLFTILSLVVAELVWGVAGMVLAIPLLGMVKIVCDHVPVLQPYGFLIGKEKKDDDKPSFAKRIKQAFSRTTS